MISSILFFVKLIICFLPFALFIFFNGKANVKKEVRYKQFAMPLIAVIYSVVLITLLDWLVGLCETLFSLIADLFENIGLEGVGRFLDNLYDSLGVFLSIIIFNCLALLLYVFLKRIITLILGKINVSEGTFIGSVVGLFYYYDEQEEKWFIKEHFGQARTFIKTAYYAACFVSGIAFLISCGLALNRAIASPFYPVFAIIIIGEMAFFIDGLRSDEQKSDLKMQADNSKHIAMYSLLRKPLKALFGDKLAADGTTVNNGSDSGGSIEDILVDLEKTENHVGQNYAFFIRRKMETGLKPNVDYVRSGYELAMGNSLLFNTPFYDKLNPYVFYAINRELLTGGKVLIVLGRHGTEDDLLDWSERGICAVSNIPDLWKISVLNGKKTDEDDLPDIGIISRSGVHDLDIHKNNLTFLKKVSFVVIVEPSRLVTTAQIGLNLLIKCCGKEREVTFCSVDRNCDGLVDSLSHILMTNITEVSATEYPHGMSSYMYWTADDDYLQHRMLSGVSRCLGMGTEFSMVALRNQVEKTVWYGGEAFPVMDAHWIAKQYYYNLLDFAKRTTTQETFDKCFTTSFNMCNERVNDYSFITVEDDRNNLFETRRNFATIAEKQGFVNVISSEYMLREYMATNTELFTADAKAIPYITADYARTKRNAILSLCLLMCIDAVKVEALERQLVMLNMDTEDPVAEVWNEICVIFGEEPEFDSRNNPILVFKGKDGKTVRFEKASTILYKRAYSIESGKFESVYTIENTDFSRIILDDLQNASYIAEKESNDVYIGTELKGHVYQKYMPGQFFTLNGKYYEMISTTKDNRILVRRASEHIGGRLSYRQVRNYTIHSVDNSSTMGALKTINNIDIYYQFADFSVETPGYWKLRAHNDFDNGDLIHINGVPKREYHHKQILKFDFSKLGDAFTDSVRMTLTNLLNEVFVTMFADNQPFISAITPGSYNAPLTYSLDVNEGIASSDKCIYIIEDSQLDIGLLIAVERNINRILQVVCDYLVWNKEQIDESIKAQEATDEETKPESFNAFEEEQEKPEKKKGFFARIGAWFKGLFKRKKSKKGDKEQPTENETETIDTEATEESETTVPADVEQELEFDEELEELEELEDLEELDEFEELETEEETENVAEIVEEIEEVELVEETVAETSVTDSDNGEETLAPETVIEIAEQTENVTDAPIETVVEDSVMDSEAEEADEETETVSETVENVAEVEADETDATQENNTEETEAIEDTEITEEILNEADTDSAIDSPSKENEELSPKEQKKAAKLAKKAEKLEQKLLKKQAKADKKAERKKEKEARKLEKAERKKAKKEKGTDKVTDVEAGASEEAQLVSAGANIEEEVSNDE